MAINKSSSASAAANVTIANFAPRGTPPAWQLTAANVITRLADVTIAGENTKSDEFFVVSSFVVS
jgi:hypothetical protein